MGWKEASGASGDRQLRGRCNTALRVMLFLLSPAKALAFDSSNAADKDTCKQSCDARSALAGAKSSTAPEMLESTSILVDVMKSKSIAELKELMKLSGSLATLNYHR